MGGTEKGARADRGGAGSRREDGSNPAIVPVPAGGAIQRQREHGRRVEFCMRAANRSVSSWIPAVTGGAFGAERGFSEAGQALPVTAGWKTGFPADSSNGVRDVLREA